MRTYEVSFISGHTLRFSIIRVTAVNKEQAVEKAFDMEGRAFEHKLISVKEVS